MADEVVFTDQEQTIGHIETHTGSIIIAEGLLESELNLRSQDFVNLDLKLDHKRVPIIATKQGGRRYLLIPLDAATPIANNSKEIVTVEGQVEMEKKKEADDSNE